MRIGQTRFTKFQVIAFLGLKSELLCGICKQLLNDEYSLYLSWTKTRQPKRLSINLDVDHILPKSKGGTNEIDNLQLTHRTCNNRKGNTVDNSS